MFSSKKITKIFHLKSRENHKLNIEQTMNEKMRRKYCTSTNYYYISSIDQYESNKMTAQKMIIDEVNYSCNDQNMMQYHKIKEIEKEIEQLTEYYKYYTQKPMLFFKDYFQLLLQYHEKKKINQYNRLKAILCLDGTYFESKKMEEENSNLFSKMIRDKSKKSYPSVHRTTNQNILLELDTTNPTLNCTDESMLLRRMRNKLSEYIGEGNSQKKTLAQIDDHYNFTKKNIQNNRVSHNFNNKNGENKIKKFKKNTIITANSYIRKNNRQKNNSCDFRPMDKVTAIFEVRNTKKRKNLSMDNVGVDNLISKKSRKNLIIQDYKKQQKNEKDREKYQCNFRTNLQQLKTKIRKQKQKIKKSYIKSYTGSNESTCEKFIAKKNIFL